MKEITLYECKDCEAIMQSALMCSQCEKPLVPVVYVREEKTPITAYQLQARLAKNIAAHDEETRAMVERAENSMSGLDGFPNLIEIRRDQMIAKHRDALKIVIDLIEIMESEASE